MSTLAPPKAPFHSASRPTAREAPSRRRILFWCLLISAVPIDAGVLYHGASLLVASDAANAPTAPAIAVPYEDKSDLWDRFRSLSVQEDGRAKPLDTFCRESVRSISGREEIEGHDAVAVVLSWLLLSDADAEREQEAAARMHCDWERYPFLLCDQPELRRLLEEERKQADEAAGLLHGRHAAPRLLRSSRQLARLVEEALRKQKQTERPPLTALERAALEVQGRLDLYDRIRGGGAVEDGRPVSHPPGDYRLIALDRAGGAWFSLRSVCAFAATPAAWDAALKARAADNPDLYEDVPPQPFPVEEARRVRDVFADLQEAYRSGEEARFAAAATAFRDTLAQAPAPMAGWELWYNRVNPFRKAWLTSLPATLLLGASLLLGGRGRRVGRWLYAGGLLAMAVAAAWAAVGFVCRVRVSGRPPVSNMYESLIWVAFLTALLGLVLEMIYHHGVPALAGGLVATLGFVLADQLPLAFSPSIQPLQAVLRSNYWLLVHVLTIVSSYAAFALAWGLGNFNLALILYAPRRRDLIAALSGFAYRAIQVGVLLLFSGTMLGGFWAAESWGRFWGWDPKEVWALVALLCYLIPLHARYAGWLGDFGLAVCSVVCFASVVMAWYGVNFVLGAGLHSYGFGSGDHAWIYLAGMSNISLVVHAALRYLSRPASAVA